MKVVKFGGTSLASAEQIEKIGAIIKSDQDRRIVVVSAPGKRHPDDVKVTDLLINTARNYLDGQDCGDSISKVIDRYTDIAEDLGIDTDRISCKATTTDSLGFEGSEEGVSCHAVTLITK